jgi:outer membrane immunogenic protein
MISGLVCMLAAVNAQHAQADPAGWTGCHAGVNAGYGWSSISGTDTGINAAIGSATARGGALGGQLGCDRQAANWVWGAQISADITNLTGSHLYAGGSGPADVVTYDIKSLVSITGRIGHLLQPDTLAYMKAGGAWARTNHDDSDPAPLSGVPYVGNTEVTRNGWLVGIGLERKSGKDMSYYAEYNYMDFGRRAVTIAYSDGVIANYSFRQNMSLLGFGVNYRF